MSAHRIFRERIAEAQRRCGTDKALWLRPRLSEMPAPMARYDDPFFPFSKALIDVTHDVVCTYLFDMAAYLALGAAGAVALERSIAAARAFNVAALLHGQFASADYLHAAGGSGFNADGVTVTANAPLSIIQAYSTVFHEAVVIFKAGDEPTLSQWAIWDTAAARITITGTDAEVQRVTMQVMGDEVLYAGHGDDFAAQSRAALLVGTR
ncbi:MAG: hypothetical protein SF162_04685 [bacterium]|nr:hypothetical protein [bacterium]